MKKLLCLTLGLFAYGVTHATNSWHMSMTNGGLHGYDKITESYTTGGDDYIVCKDPGYDDCYWQLNPPAHVVTTTGNIDPQRDIVPNVKDQVNHGHYSGSYNVVGTMVTVVVSWTGTATNTELTLTYNNH